MPVSNLFDRILSASQVEQAVVDTLKFWFPRYLREMENQLDLPPNTLETPENYLNRNSFDAQAGEKTPKIVVISPGLASAPVKTGESKYRATWRIGVGVAIPDKTEDDANLKVKAYGAVIRAVLEQNGSLTPKGFAAETTWVDESYPDLPIRGQLTQYRAAGIFFEVQVENVLTRWAGPDDPSQTDYGEVQKVVITTTKVAIKDEV